VDDGSSGGVEIARRRERELDFVTVLSAPQHESDFGPDRLALAKGPGLQLRLRQAGWQEFTHQQLDGDVKLPPQWFTTLPNASADPRLGPTGGA
jgi:hypothetical protein